MLSFHGIAAYYRNKLFPILTPRLPVNSPRELVRRELRQLKRMSGSRIAVPRM